jgi:hypothetical protein
VGQCVQLHPNDGVLLCNKTPAFHLNEMTGRSDWTFASGFAPKKRLIGGAFLMVATRAIRERCFWGWLLDWFSSGGDAASDLDEGPLHPLAAGDLKKNCLPNHDRDGQPLTFMSRH